MRVLCTFFCFFCVLFPFYPNPDVLPSTSSTTLTPSLNNALHPSVLYNSGSTLQVPGRFKFQSFSVKISESYFGKRKNKRVGGGRITRCSPLLPAKKKENKYEYKKRDRMGRKSAGVQRKTHLETKQKNLFFLPGVAPPKLPARLNFVYNELYYSSVACFSRRCLLYILSRSKDQKQQSEITRIKAALFSRRIFN